mgnify:CR=1 FL=1
MNPDVNSRPWWTVPGVLLAVFAAIVVVVIVVGTVDGGATVAVEGRDPDCDVLSAAEGCDYVVTTPSADPLAIIAAVEPPTVASAFVIEADRTCEAADVETPCQIRITVDDSAIETIDGGMQTRLVVTVAGMDATTSIDLG